ncbi:MAG: fructose-6-phosphate aldolase [Fimbriimonadia bacterium]|jgi:transaldolase
MKLFVDTGLVDEVRTAHEWGILDGVTTNPTLIAKSGRGFKETVVEMCEIVREGCVSAEVVATDYEGMMREAHEIASWHPNVVIKVPMTRDGIRTVRTLSSQGIRTNCTLVFSVSQALLAAKAGATFISNFVGRVDDISGGGMEAVAATVQAMENYGFPSEVLVASVRHPMHVVEAMECGAHIATMPFKVLEQMFLHPLTDIGLQRFLDDFHNAGLKIFS